MKKKFNYKCEFTENKNSLLVYYLISIVADFLKLLIIGTCYYCIHIHLIELDFSCILIFYYFSCNLNRIHNDKTI